MREELLNMHLYINKTMVLVTHDIDEAFKILKMIRKEGNLNDPLTDLVIQLALGFRAGDNIGIKSAWNTHNDFLIKDPLVSAIVRLFRGIMS